LRIAPRAVSAVSTAGLIRLALAATTAFTLVACAAPHGAQQERRFLAGSAIPVYATRDEAFDVSTGGTGAMPIAVLSLQQVTVVAVPPTRHGGSPAVAEIRGNSGLKGWISWPSLQLLRAHTQADVAPS
jgi:hypothetical protein